MTTRTAPRHRKATRPLTPVSHIAPATRRGLAVAATSGLALTMIATGANAASSTEVAGSAGSLEASSTGVNAIAADAQAAIQTNAAITVSADVAAPADTAAVAAVTAEAPVVEEPEPVVQADNDNDRPATASTQNAQSNQSGASNANSSQGSSSGSNQQKPSQQTPPPSANGSAIVATAWQGVGVPYVYGGTSTSGWDCSGFVQWVFRQNGISLPRTSQAQGAAGRQVSAAEAQPGDIVYYGGHVGIYAGNGMMIDAGNPRVGTSYRAVYGSPSYIRVG